MPAAMGVCSYIKNRVLRISAYIEVKHNPVTMQPIDYSRAWKEISSNQIRDVR